MPETTWTKQVIAFALITAFIAVIFGWMFYPPRNLDPTALAIINMLIGALVAKVSDVVGFFFGSSEGSKAKDDAQNKTIERLTQAAPENSHAVTAAAVAAAPAAAKAAAPPAAEVAAPPAAEIAVAEEFAKRDHHA